VGSVLRATVEKQITNFSHHMLLSNLQQKLHQDFKNYFCSYHRFSLGTKDLLAAQLRLSKVII